MAGSVFDVIGPSMVGPSSSHTAGAVRIGLIARAIADHDWQQAKIGLHGSFAATGAGHATDRALVAGLLGFEPDDDRLKDALELASQAGKKVTFECIDLGDEVHPNTAVIDLAGGDGQERRVIGSSVGGGSIEIVGIDSYRTSFDGSLDTLLLWHTDQPGFLARLTALLACVDANIASIRTSRRRRAREAVTLVELDAVLDKHVLAVARMIHSVSHLISIERLHG